MVQAQVLAFLSSLQASREANREARVREEQKERKITEMFYSEKILNPGGDCKLDSNHWTVDCTVVMGLELWERLSSMIFFVFKIQLFKKCKKCINKKEIDWQNIFLKNP